MTRKMKIPKKLRQHCWVNIFGKVYSHTCYINWCNTVIDVWSFEVGHNIAEKYGGTLNLDNLFPICSLCNKSMGTTSIDDWSKLKVGNKNTTPRSHDLSQTLNSAVTPIGTITAPSAPSTPRSVTLSFD